MYHHAAVCSFLRDIVATRFYWMRGSPFAQTCARQRRAYSAFGKNLRSLLSTSYPRFSATFQADE
jgi:hypothetical protein